MNKIKCIIVLIIILGFCGCASNKIVDDNKENINENKEDFNDSEIESSEQKEEQEVIEDVFMVGNSVKYNWDCEVSLNNIKDISLFSNMFISNDGMLYEFDLLKEYSTTKNHCKKIETDKTFDKFINGAIISTDKKIYAYLDGVFEERIYGWTGAFHYDLFDYNENVIVLNLFLDSNPKYGIVKDNKVYGYDTNSFNSDDIKTEKELYSFAADEYFIGIYGSYIKTNKAYYKYGIINKKDCDKYADIECVYGIVKDELVTNSYDKIFYLNNRYIIFKNDLNHIYTDIFGG